jgi:hypothetical protein
VERGRAQLEERLEQHVPDIDDDNYFRTHWNAKYARSASDNDYDEHAPAYLSGREAQRSENYRSRD